MQAAFKGFAARIEREHNDRAWAVWHVAALMRKKRMPSLKRLQSRKRRDPQTWQQQLNMAKMLNAAFGGRVVQKQKKRRR